MTLSASRKSNHPVRVLLVDDHFEGLRARRAVLEEMGHQAVSTTSPREALALFSAQPFDLVITDQRMPEMTGEELIRQIRQVNPNVPCILLSGFAEVLGMSEQSTGADAVIMKSNHEVAHLTWTVDKLIDPKTKRKPPSGASPPALRRRKGLSSS